MALTTAAVAVARGPSDGPGFAELDHGLVGVLSKQKEVVLSFSAGLSQHIWGHAYRAAVLDGHRDELLHVLQAHDVEAVQVAMERMLQ
ncbi:hypothetical protein JIX56_05225 [Streptomyces sp. CA-210063]|uniref:hypothetical protein n=1 Tax=Streptomyces sp. CA-210063 TaxID=2801029 RepID=UPI00214B047C|nr:hypothetical protein [Streptomyces sp. CA-210063]UUU29344.1 hypothetical protein JIX56_05225 [Streptomyces sp. CA-210063]